MNKKNYPKSNNNEEEEDQFDYLYYNRNPKAQSIIDKGAMTIAKPSIENKYYKSLSDSIGSNYSPKAKLLNLKNLKNKCNSFNLFNNLILLFTNS
jgi:hypothetical protein